MMKLIIDDFVMLGRTIPVETKNSGITVCACGYSKELNQLIRIYPLSRTDRIKAWDICSMELVKGNDNRPESFKVSSYLVTGKKDKKEGYEELFSFVKPSIKDLNRCNRSLAILSPTNYKMDVEEYGPNFEQASLFEWDRAYIPKYLPHLRVQNDDKTKNLLWIRDWGLGELYRKQSSKIDSLTDAQRHSYFSKALNLKDDRYKHLFVIGNMKNRRNAWLCITVLRFKIAHLENSKQASLL